jgi:hypothetical protein
MMVVLDVERLGRDLALDIRRLARAFVTTRSSVPGRPGVRELGVPLRERRPAQGEPTCVSNRLTSCDRLWVAARVRSP